MHHTSGHAGQRHPPHHTHQATPDSHHAVLEEVLRGDAVRAVPKQKKQNARPKTFRAKSAGKMTNKAIRWQKTTDIGTLEPSP